MVLFKTRKVLVKMCFYEVVPMRGGTMRLYDCFYLFGVSAVHSFPRQLGHLEFVCLLGFWPRYRSFCLLAWVAQVGGGPGLPFLACLLEVAQVWCGPGGYIFQFVSFIVTLVAGPGLFFSLI